MLKPYNKEILNKFDSVILHLIIFITALTVFDDFDSPIIITITFVLMILPLLNFIALTLFLHKEDLKKMATYFISKRDAPNSDNSVNSNEVPMKEFDKIVDDTTRRTTTVTICDT